ncbi:MAG: helix-turn-helix transcriptional regulator [Gammaproteobacteria bacterium]|nr:helix-turn-helix transcriptional regulator [Gammaproteobacteria bacterium]
MKLAQLGRNLKDSRKRRFPADNLARFALRIGVSRATLQKMEQGDLSVSMEKYYRAGKLLGLERDFEQLLHLPKSLFDD